MGVHQVYAQIYKEKVQNVIVCTDFEMANYLARAIYGDEAFSVNCSKIPCGPGDSYRDGLFYKVLEDGTEKLLGSGSSIEDQVNELSASVEFLSMVVPDADTYLAPSEEETE